ncbi:hypothetical protein BEL04_18300 [Mucilaginibacter sp. PPCGB 2223]|uniref:DUF1272 domain-containing protein n=1 Tax=Mucilaginibacter sp. PPCGB 2223 TaxID=1886027 RepID=UPI00082717CF|nr:DUF1272 domain-containing protein [Mucilaginibacter sp. PPCGB 2223]OCX51951.1 hypothetical protein BEL04_18300 [Mucilaginibacter sp. PPCGB 2223]
MLEIKPTCENCNKPLPNDSAEAMICSFECTFCADCVNHVLENVCPNCGGGFVQRPTRPKVKLERNPVGTRVVYKPVDLTEFALLKEQYKNIAPDKR